MIKVYVVIEPEGIQAITVEGKVLEGDKADQFYQTLKPILRKLDTDIRCLTQDQGEERCNEDCTDFRS